MKNLKILMALCAVSLFLFANQISAQSEVLFKMHGSNTVGAKLAPAFAEQYLRGKLGARNVQYIPSGKPEEGEVVGETSSGKRVIQIHAHGSSTSFRALQAGEADIGMSSRPIKQKEITKLKSLGVSDQTDSEYVIGLDGIAVVVNQKNPLASLSVDQLAKIFSGKIRSWRELGVSMGKIKVYARDKNSGTYDTFKNLVLGKKIKLTPSAKRYASNAKLSDDVANDPAAIGFVGLPYIRQSRAIKVSPGSARARMPSSFNVATEDYALSRRLFMYVPNQTSNKYVNEFMEFVESSSGQQIVREVGFISQNLSALEYQVTKSYPQEYRNYVKNAKRLSVNFRFRKDSMKLDSRADRDLDRVAEYVKKNKEIKEVMLFGFSEDARIPIHNIALSENRADMVERELRKRGITVHRIRGYGAYENVADNALKEKNRRVEIWIK